MGMEISVKGEKTEGKMQGPLFPRLHVNDTKKIGTRAPPRNKMALYDQQLSISTSQKPTIPTSSSSLAPPPANGCMLTNPTSLTTSSLSVGSEKSMFSPYKNSTASIQPNGMKQTSSSNEGISEKISMMTHINNDNNANVAECPLPSLQRQAFEPCNLSQFKWPPTRDKNETHDQLRLPTFVHPRMSSDSHKDRQYVGPNCTLELQTTPPNNAKPLMSTEVDVSEAKKRVDKNIMTPTTRAIDSMSTNPKLALEPLTEEQNTGASSNSRPSITANKHDRSSEVDETEIIKTRGDDDNMLKPGKKVCRSDATDELKPKVVSVVSNASILRSESCHESVVTDAIDHHNPTLNNNAANGNHHLEEKDRSNSSVKDSAPQQIVLSPEVVVKMIGQDEFQKARNTLIQQQAVFAKQVFELHRLVKVQKMLSSSETILSKDHLPFGKELLPPFIPEAPTWQNNRSTNHGHSKTKAPPTENTVEIIRPPLPPFNADIASIATNNYPAHNNTNNISKSANSNTMPMWCLPAPGNQWLFPVISPSEGLIYKPCYPPPPPPLPEAQGSFLGTLYNEGGPTHTNTPSEEYLNNNTSSYGGSASANTSHMGPMYFAPYGMPILNPFAGSAPAAAFKQVPSFNSLNGGYSSSFNVAEGVKLESTMTTSSCAKKVRTSYDALPLFPTAPSTTTTTTLDFGQNMQSCSNEKNAQVIKVIPHNPRLASESAARIVKLIQDERKHYCN